MPHPNRFEKLRFNRGLFFSMSTLEQFAFQTPLYSKIDLPKDLILKAILCGLKFYNVDGHCPKCGKNSTFSGGNRKLNLGVETVEVQNLRTFAGYKHLDMTCARDNKHKLLYWFLLMPDTVEKVGQNPSLADIANDEAATYRSVLNKNDASELHKAIGLAAHGVGIGSFVYLRRIFERLIYDRFNNFKDVEGWDEADFLKLKMDDKVKYLKGHIPNFLYENRKLYGILSKGIHELSDEVCLKAFEPLKLSIKIILEEDKKKKEELEMQKAAADAIKAFEP
jgi:hypothetical protein